MIFDNDSMIADGLAHDGTPTVIDTGNADAGPGNKIRFFVIGSSVAGATGVVFTDGSTDTAADALLTLTCTSAEINAGIEIELSSTHAQYVQADLVGTTSAGTWTCGVILGCGQTNQ